MNYFLAVRQIIPRFASLPAGSPINNKTTTTMQKTITINGIKLTAAAIRRAPQTEAVGGHNIAETKAGEIHWMEWGDSGEVHIFNAGAVRRDGAFGSKIAFLA